MTGRVRGPRPPAATRTLAQLPEKAAAAAIDLVYGPLVENPGRVGRALRFELEGLHVARRGDYRVIYEIDVEARQIVVHAIAHRSDAYRRRQRTTAPHPWPAAAA